MSTNEGKLDAADLADAIRQMGVEPEQVYFRIISKARIDTVYAKGTDRNSASANHGGESRYETRAMDELGVSNRFYTTYLTDGASLVAPNAINSFNLLYSAIVIYRKDPNI